ncbi:MAG: hypothetical protein E7670_06490 [Ruminococcaceae bacterium]|nr:hypothetical protein [Oscillospiraceae bacterium]
MSENKSWFSNSYRRNLVDMHLEDWDSAFMSEFDPEAYCENLKKAKIKSAMIYFQSHVGYCYYPTKSGKMHSALIGREDAVKRLVDLCHENGIDVIGYYSLIYNTYERLRHPEWRMQSASGSDKSGMWLGSRYGLNCPNNPDYRAFIREQIKEISEYFTVEGMFYDMTFWPKWCTCPHCQMRFLKETGYAGIPAPDTWDLDEFWAFRQKRDEWMAEFAQYVTDCSKEFMPHASVEHNYAQSCVKNHTNSEKVANACDYVGGDLHGKNLLINSFATKYWRAVTKNPPFEYMLSRCADSLQCHTITKPESQLTVEMFVTAAHHGASFVIDAMDPVGTLDGRVYDLIGRVFDKQIPYEPYFHGTPIEDVAVYYTLEGRYNRFKESSDSRECCISTTAALVQKHIPMGVKSNLISDRLGEHKLVFAPRLSGLEEKDRKNICDYVRNGGVFYFSGGEEPKLMEELLGATVEKNTPVKHIYLAPTKEGEDLFDFFTVKYPLPMSSTAPMIKTWNKDAKILAYLTLPYIDENDPSRYSSIHSNPPCHIPTKTPALLEVKYGKGTVVWCAGTYEYDKRDCYNNFTTSIIRRYFPESEQSVITTAPRQVEICAYRLKDGYQLNFVDQLYTDEELIVRDFEVGVKMSEEEAKNIEGVYVRPNGESLTYRYENGYLKFSIESLLLFRMVEIKIK